MPERMPHSEQISENHIYRWFTDIVNHGCLKHFPDLLRVKGGAGAKMEHSTPFGDGMSLTMELKDTRAVKALCATCLSQADLICTGIVAALTVIIQSFADGGLPGNDGYRVTTYPDGRQEHTRYFAVTFKHVFMRKFRAVAAVCPHDTLATIFHNAMTRIGDEIGNFSRHPDTACKFVCEELTAPWTCPGSVAANPAPALEPERAARVDTKSGRCFAWDSKGECDKGKACPYRGAHHSKPTRKPTRPSRPRPSSRYSSEEDSPPRRSSRRDERPRDDRRGDRREDDRRDNDRRKEVRWERKWERK